MLDTPTTVPDQGFNRLALRLTTDKPWLMEAEMQFEIRGRDVDITETLRGHIERRLGFALGRFTRRIKRILVRVGDLNGPRGGIDKGCRVAILLAPSTTVVMEDRDSDVYVAIDRVADKAGRYIGRRLKRPRRGSPAMRIAELLS
jgi:putative sigma-54 modulation protein